MDIETKTINKKMIPICISLYDGKISKSFFISDFDNSNEMIKKAILFLVQRKYNNYKIYFHNFSSFDSIFLLNNLIQVANLVKPIIRDGKIIELRAEFNYNDNKKTVIVFRDSLLLLPSSLAKLAINFNCGKKQLFPYNFINKENIPLNYVGKIPDTCYF
ncbi:DNA polymerase, partial [Actinotalea ferrariae]